jgi:hypothetical protein
MFAQYLRSSGMLSSVDWYLVTDVLGKPIGPILKGQAVQDCLTLQDGIDSLFRNVVTDHQCTLRNIPEE